MSETPRRGNSTSALEVASEQEQADRSFVDFKEALDALTDYEQALSFLHTKPELTAKDYADLMLAQKTQAALERFVEAKYTESELDRSVVLRLLDAAIKQLTTALRWNEHEYAEAIKACDQAGQQRLQQEIDRCNAQINETKIQKEWYKTR
jgi:hypothetical protein